MKLLSSFAATATILLSYNFNFLHAASLSSPVECTLPVSVGKCRGSIRAFYFNAEENACKFFLYSGCDGNENRFESAESCQSRCLPDARRKRQDEQAQDICFLPPIRTAGISCLGFMPRFTFDLATRQCRSYIYGGCGRTANLFDTEQDCLATCGQHKSP